MSTKSQPNINNSVNETRTMIKSTSNAILLSNNNSVPEEPIDEECLTNELQEQPEQHILKQAQRKAPTVYVNPNLIIEQER